MIITQHLSYTGKSGYPGYSVVYTTVGSERTMNPSSQEMLKYQIKAWKLGLMGLILDYNRSRLNKKKKSISSLVVCIPNEQAE